ACVSWCRGRGPRTEPAAVARRKRNLIGPGSAPRALHGVDVSRGNRRSMDAFEVNKTVGAVLAALLVIFGSRTMLDIISREHRPEKPGWAIPVKEVAAPTKEPAAP